MTHDEQWLLEEKYNGVATEEFEADKVRLAHNEPVAYVIGYQPFIGLKIHLDSHPLIPRPETEWWTEQLLKEASHTRTFLDLCAGSGAIGCAALAKLPDAHVYFGEVDSVHEATIIKNISSNMLGASRADIRIGDLFEPFGEMRFDVIAINPPYVPESRVLPASVIDYEPSHALYAGDDGLTLIRRIAKELSLHLSESGTAWIECDSAHTEMARTLCVEQGLRAEIRTDQYDVPRLIVVSFT